MPIGRNEPCPCGSGRKFKVCCLRLARKLETDDGGPAAPDPPARFREGVALALAAGADVVTAEVRAAVALAGELSLDSSALEDRSFEPCLLAFGAMAELLKQQGKGEEEVVATFLPRLPFDVVVDPEGRTAGDVILERYGATLPRAACDALRALVEAEDALCRVERAGGRVLVEDVRSGTKLPAPDGFRAEGPGMVCRLVRHRGRHVTLDAGLVDDPDDPWYLEDFERAMDAAASLSREIGLRLRSRTKGAAIGFELLDAAEAMDDEDDAPRPDIRNTEGHRLVFTTLRWDVAWEAGARESLARMAGLGLEETKEGLVGTFIKVQPPKARKVPGETLTVGTLKLAGGRITVETNSAERAERLRKKLDRALGKTATFRSVTSEPLDEALEKPVDPIAEARRKAEQEKLMALPEVREALAKMGRDHSLAWCDMVIPALGNRRPRTLVKTESGRRKVEALLADFEQHQRRNPDNRSPMDLGLIRTELGLDRGR
jgi:hypothetical protein